MRHYLFLTNISWTRWTRVLEWICSSLQLNCKRSLAGPRTTRGQQPRPFKIQDGKLSRTRVHGRFFSSLHFCYIFSFTICRQASCDFVPHIILCCDHTCPPKNKAIITHFLLQVRGNGSLLVNKTFSSLHVSFRDTYDTEEEEEGSPENKTTAKNVIEQRSANLITVQSGASSCSKGSADCF